MSIGIIIDGVIHQTIATTTDSGVELHIVGGQWVTAPTMEEAKVKLTQAVRRDLALVDGRHW